MISCLLVVILARAEILGRVHTGDRIDRTVDSVASVYAALRWEFIQHHRDWYVYCTQWLLV